MLARWLSFAAFDAAWPILAFLSLAALAGRTRPLRRTCINLALVFAGILDFVLHQPPPPPEIDAGFRETVLLDGCVVEPTVFSPGREQFTLELDWRARARVSLALDENGADDPSPQQMLAYGQRVEIEARVRSPHNYDNPAGFDYAAYLARQNIFLDGGDASAFTRDRSSRPLRLTSTIHRVCAAYSSAPKNRPALRGRQLLDWNDGRHPDRRNFRPGARLDRRFPAHRNVSRSGDLRRPRHGARRSIAVPLAAVRRPGTGRVGGHGRGRVALRAGQRILGAGGAGCGWIQPVPDRAISLPPHAHLKLACRDRPRLRAMGSERPV